MTGKMELNYSEIVTTKELNIEFLRIRNEKLSRIKVVSSIDVEQATQDTLKEMLYAGK